MKGIIFLTMSAMAGICFERGISFLAGGRA